MAPKGDGDRSIRISPAAAIQRAHGPWKVFGHTGVVAFSRTGDAATSSDATMLRKFGDVPDDLSAL
jgi:anthranilate phosphoribosyltransferase